MSGHFSVSSQGPSSRRWISIGAVALFHGLVLWGLWQTEFRTTLVQASTLFVSMIEEQKPRPPEPPRPEVKLRHPEAKPVEAPPQIVAQAPVTAPTEYVAPPPPPVVAPPPEPAPPPPAPAAPPARVSLPELAVACTERTPPVYPAFARRMGEQGQVVLRVFLDEHGKVTDAVVSKTSGSPRLDEAALQAVRRWQCQPAMRDGHATPAVALQPFNFVLDRT